MQKAGNQPCPPLSFSPTKRDKEKEMSKQNSLLMIMTINQDPPTLSSQMHKAVFTVNLQPTNNKGKMDSDHPSKRSAATQ